MGLDLGPVEYLTFDCYGTLIDWETGILGALRPVLASKGVDLTDQQILETYAELEAELEAGPYMRYRNVLAGVVDGFGQRFGFEVGADDRIALQQSIGAWPAFPDSAAALERLATRFKLVVLSNIDDELFQGSGTKLGNPFHRVITAEQIGSYKPSTENFEFLIHALGGDTRRIVHVAQSLYHDILPANRLGMQTVWINRRRDLPGAGATPMAHAKATKELSSLADLADLVDEVRATP